MAKIICISEGTHRPGSNEIGDIVDVVESTDQGNYSHFRVIETPGTRDQVVAILKTKIVNTQVEENGKVSWYDNTTKQWRELKVAPKYQLNLSGNGNLADIENNITKNPNNSSLLLIG